MKFDKIIYLRYIPLTKKIYQDFNMQSIIDIGIKVEYWDFTDLFFAHTFDQEDSSYLVDTHKFNSYKALEVAIAAQDRSKTLFVSIVTYENRVTMLYKLLTKYDCLLSVFGRNMYPQYQQVNACKYLAKRLLAITPSKLINYLRAGQALKLKRNGTIKGYDVIFQGGTQGWKGIGQIEYAEVEKAKLVMVNSDDYDNYLLLRDTPRLIEEQYILFLDEYLPFHPDTKLFGVKTIALDQYYKDLNDYFDRVEAQYGVPVIVAAHPKALKYEETNYFNGRQIYFGKSAELSRDAHFVLTHDSTSINYPIDFDVRLHFITSHKIEALMCEVHNNVIRFAQYLGCNWQYFDNSNEPVNVIAKVPQEGYQNYKYDFQCSKETENRHTKDIVIEFLTH